MNVHILLEKVKVLMEVICHPPLLSNLFTVTKNNTCLVKLLDALALCMCCDNYDLRRYVSLMVV